MNGRMMLMLAACGVLFGGIFGFKWFGNRMMNQFFDSAPVPAVTVSTTPARTDTWELTLAAVGTLRAVRGTDVTTEASGIIDSIQFDSGDNVAAGAILLTLDRSTNLAELQALEAQAALSRQELARAESLFESNAVARSELDRRAAERAADEANVEAQRARLAQKVIRAPFAGELGLRQVDLGQHLSPGTPIVSLQALDPIHVNFKLPQHQLAQVRTGQPVTVRLETYAGNEAFAAAPFAGEITAIEPAIDVATRNFEAQATLRNPDHLLRPGMFAQVEIDLQKSDAVVVVPQTAVSFNPYGDSVWVIEEAADGEFGAERRLVKIGRRRGDLVQIVEGLAAGEQVATSGLLKLRNGVPVIVNNGVQPSAESAPRPPNS
jgi:membrane fusion protein (multidrug efflux system)